MKTIITTGKRSADIDAFACAVAYKELLSLKGIESEILITGPLNDTVTKSILDWGIDYDKTDDSKHSNYIVVDCSEIEAIPEVANRNNVLEVWDHRFGYQDNWDGEKTRIIIDEVGACATLIWEEFKKLKLDKNISKVSANLLYTAIFSNTLNFKSSVTNSRDTDAFEDLKKYIDLPNGWIEIYYQESEEQIFKDSESAIRNDTKVLEFKDKNIKVTIGQIELWNSFKFINENKTTIKNVLSGFGNEEWFMTAPSISEGKNYIYTENQNVKNLLINIIDVKFDGDLGTTSKLWLRKEILKKMLI